MELETYYAVGGFVSTILLVAVGVDQAYQSLSHKRTNEPPLLPYRIPIIGHALSFNSDCLRLFRTAQCDSSNWYLMFADFSCSEYFPGSQAYSLLSFGKRVYVRFLIFGVSCNLLTICMCTGIHQLQRRFYCLP